MENTKKGSYLGKNKKEKFANLAEDEIKNR